MSLCQKSQYSQGYSFPSNHVWRWDLDYKDTELWRVDAFEVVLEKNLESPLDWKEIKQVNSEGNQPWIFIGRTKAEAEDPVLWPPDAMSQPIGKKTWCWESWRRKEKGVTENEMVGWHHQLNRHEFERNPGDNEGQGNLDATVHVFAMSWTWLSD